MKQPDFLLGGTSTNSDESSVGDKVSLFGVYSAFFLTENLQIYQGVRLGWLLVGSLRPATTLLVPRDGKCFHCSCYVASVIHVRIGGLVRG